MDNPETNDNLNMNNRENISELQACDQQSIETESEESKQKIQTENTSDDMNNVQAIEFKKPFSQIASSKQSKIGKTQGVNIKGQHKVLSKLDDPTLKIYEVISKNTEEENITSDTKNIPVPYSEPSWGGKPEKEYKLEVLKSGMILETIDLTESFHVVGRLPSCNLTCAHPSISRYHAIIQYRAIEEEKNSKGFYLYDLESTHGTYWNDYRIKPRTYVRLYGGHMIKFGYSKRKYILQAPPEDQEEESELTVTQLKEKRMNELREREIRQQEMEEAEEKAKEAEENDGIDWGMREDADEETDLTENPYASMIDEELYLDDPKKTLRGWFEREGYDLQYQVEEKGIGQFLCWVNLPKECFDGRSIRAEVVVKGKKKESVVQCALEACRILDKHGLLRQANHESRKKKTKNWEEEDYYDSDEDNFLDRTGTVERKREQRMKQAGKFEEKIETYGSLTEKHKDILKKILHLTQRLMDVKECDTKDKESNEDSLDIFMSNLNAATLSKSDITNMKIELQNLRKEEEKLCKLINLTKPANLPPLVNQEINSETDDSKDIYFTKTTRKQSRKSKQDIEKNKHNSGEICAPVLNSNYITSNAEEIEEEEDEDDVEEKEEDRIHNKEDVCNKTMHKSECEKFTLYKNDLKTQDDIEMDEKLTYISGKASQGTERSESDANIGDNKKRKKDKKLEKSKNLKGYYDEDIHSNEYSTWIPPQDQTGDGRTSLNDKYGY